MYKQFHVNEDAQRSLFAEVRRIPTKINKTTMMPDSFIEITADSIWCNVDNIENIGFGMCVSMAAETGCKTIMGYELDEEFAFPSANNSQAVLNEARLDDVNHISKEEIDATYDAEDIKKFNTSPLEFGRIGYACKAAKDDYAWKPRMECKEEAVLNENGKMEEEDDDENLYYPSRKYLLEMHVGSDTKGMRDMTLLDKEPITTYVEPSVAQKQSSKSSIRKKINCGDGTAVSQLRGQSNAANLPKNPQQGKKDNKPLSMVQDLKQKM